MVEGKNVKSEGSNTSRTYSVMTSLSVWILFVVGVLSILASFPIPVVSSGDWRLLAVGVASVFLSSFIIKTKVRSN